MWPVVGKKRKKQGGERGEGYLEKDSLDRPFPFPSTHPPAAHLPPPTCKHSWHTNYDRMLPPYTRNTSITCTTFLSMTVDCRPAGVVFGCLGGLSRLTLTVLTVVGLVVVVVAARWDCPSIPLSNSLLALTTLTPTLPLTLAMPLSSETTTLLAVLSTIFAFLLAVLLAILCRFTFRTRRQHRHIQSVVREAHHKNREMQRSMAVNAGDHRELGLGGLAAKNIHDVTSTRLARMNAAKLNLSAGTEANHDHTHTDRWNSAPRSSRSPSRFNALPESTRYDDYPLATTKPPRESYDGPSYDPDHDPESGEAAGYPYPSRSPGSLPADRGRGAGGNASGNGGSPTAPSSWATVHEDGTRSYLNGW